MKRAPFVATATIAGLAGVLTFHSRPTTTTIAASPPAKTSSSKPAKAKRGQPKSPPPKSSASPPGSKSATGTNERYGYGTLALKVTVNGSKITDVSVASIQEADPASASIASQVIPMLRSQVLAAQSAHINGISGASYTSQAYALSVQSALDKLHFK